ncbi:MAG: class I SAM-dependent methyltransferase [Alphaproteobacteria bacterium]|nr:class I SAM-dependent methyltransferase [Alphaproteobacteria bacterium]
MKMPGPHAMMPDTNHDESARMSFVFHFKEHVVKQLTPGNKLVYEKRVLPAFQRQHQRAPKNRHEVRDEMRQDEYWQMFGSLSRLYQELKQDVGEAVAFRQMDTLNARARGLRQRARKATLELDPTLAIPRYQSSVDIHLMPGGYHSERTTDDVTAGAIYDPGVYMFAMGALGDYNDDMGVSLIRWLRQKRPDFKPRRILEMGCGVGHSIIPYALAFPDAEIQAIDIGAPVLRYGQARAESMGKAIHFSQQNAEHTKFADESFDLIVSHILFHEISFKAVYNVMKESRRLLRKGGLALHLDVPVRNDQLDPYTAFMRDWSTHYNAEPFWGTLHDMDLYDPAVKAGFARDKVILDHTPLEAGKAGSMLAQGWHLFGAER